ncbi:hypothetical protein COD05_26945 [Bacillus cereus]|uniref:hypothetical protein n=1 Tax=Bacillus wiedmannii TaxID=1890302 RepID=UPI000BF2A19E|nr:hypothetical protein COJ53_13570 [Bacillus cereus]PFQ82874.1 hypothetical protein COK28_26765 [Bacillus cereus]PGP37052.1 hypothetical protein CN989_11095 [Bacillus cereus]PGT01957.1 hypothetical protein COD05_26945 [Bacillus cereus]RFB68410.1 hypothetical protein DZB94_27350 [Bacillus sp. AW]
MFKTTKNLEVSKLSIGIPQISFGVVSAEVEVHMNEHGIAGGIFKYFANPPCDNFLSISCSVFTL